jgi:hypothetical protein
MIESGFRRKVTSILRDAGFFVQTIETETGPGVPDLWWVKGGISGWLELKLIQTFPIREKTAVFKSMNHPLSNEQINWISLCLRKGGKADILVGYKLEYFFVPGSSADFMNHFTESDLRKFKLTKEQLKEKLCLTS